MNDMRSKKQQCWLKKLRTDRGTKDSRDQICEIHCAIDLRVVGIIASCVSI